MLAPKEGRRPATPEINGGKIQTRNFAHSFAEPIRVPKLTSTLLQNGERWPLRCLRREAGQQAAMYEIMSNGPEVYNLCSNHKT